MCISVILNCLFIFVCGDNINFVSTTGSDSADGLSPDTAKSLHTTLMLSLSSFQKIYVLPGMYTEGDYVNINHDNEIVGSIRADDSYGLSNTSADSDMVDVSYDIDDIETVINIQKRNSYLISLDGGKVGQVRRIRFIGKSNSTVFKIKNGELTARKCYFAGNCSCFHLNNTNAKLNIKWCVFKPNSWNTMEEVIYIYAGNMLLMEECFVKNIRKNSYNGVVLYTETTGSIIETVTIKGSDFQNCEGYDGAVFYFWRVRNIAISNCSFYHLKSRGYAAVLYLYGEPAPSGFNFHVEDVIMKDNNATERLGSQFCADEINPTPFNNANIKNVTYYPLGPDLVSDYRNGVYTDHTSLITSGDGVETLFTSLSDDVHTLGDFQEFDLLANYITLGDDDDNNDDDDKKGGLSAGAIAGIVCGVIFGLLALVGVIVLICCCCCRRSSSSKVPLNTIHPHQQSPPTVSYVSPAVDYAMPQPPPAASTNYPPPPQQLPSGPMYYPPPPSQSLTPANYPPPPPSGSDHHTSITYPPPPPSDDYPQFPAEDD